MFFFSHLMFSFSNVDSFINCCNRNFVHDFFFFFGGGGGGGVLLGKPATTESLSPASIYP